MQKFLKILFLLSLVSAKAYALEDFVLNSEPAFIPDYKNRFNFLVGVNPSMNTATDVTNVAFSYGKQLETFWLDTNLLITSGAFNKMTTNNPTATGLSSDQLEGTKSFMTTIGAGIGIETRYAQNLLPFKDIYELVAADLTYNIYKEDTSGKSFTGPGMLAKFSLYKRFSEYFSAGTQLTYNLAVLKRSADDETENSSARSLTMSYLTVGFDLSFYL